MRRLSFPLLNGATEDFGFLKVQKRMDVIGHYYETDTRSISLLQFMSKRVDNNAFGTIIIEEAALLKQEKVTK
jgi:hypothetical protein